MPDNTTRAAAHARILDDLAVAGQGLAVPAHDGARVAAASRAADYAAEQLLAAAHGAAGPVAHVIPADRGPDRNPAAVHAVVFGAASLLINFLGLVSVAAIVWGAVAVDRANRAAADGRPPVGRDMASWGVTLGGLGLAFSLLAKNMLF